MESNVKLGVIGCGKMAKYTMRYVEEKEGKIVCAYDIDQSRIGKDISVICGGDTRNVIIENVKDLEKSLKKYKPDIAIITTMSLMKDIYDVMLTCAKCGVNAITTCEEAFFPMNSNPTLTSKIAQFERMEENLKRAILMAEKTSEQIKLTAYQERDIIVSDAKKNANRIVNEALLKAETIEKESDMLRRNMIVFKRRLKDALSTQVELIEDIEKIEI